MEKKKNSSIPKKKEKTEKKDAGPTFFLKLYVAGNTPRSIKAILNLKQICHEHLKGSCDFEIIDIYQHPVLARGEQIIAAPTLIKKLPPPLRKFIGDLSDTQKILVGIDYNPKAVKKKKA
jgi:circadian clock protein KaiB